MQRHDVHPTQLQVLRKGRIPISVIYLEFWEDDGEILIKRIEGVDSAVVSYPGS